jgi:hypothetical protein
MANDAAAKLREPLAGYDAAGNVVGNDRSRAQGGGAADRDDLHVLQVSRLQAQLIHSSQ